MSERDADHEDHRLRRAVEAFLGAYEDNGLGHVGEYVDALRDALDPPTEAAR